MEFPKYEHKYLSVFDNNEDYEEQTTVIEECNWSAIRDPNQTDVDKKDYYPSVRPTNEDNKYVMNWYSSDELKKKFALEITWGYYGFEWVDYEYNGEILKGGNLYIIKEITKVPTVADGYRLQHINNFLNTQSKVTEIEWFDTSNIVSAVHAFSAVNKLLLNISEWKKLEDATNMFNNVNELSYAENITTVDLPKVKIIDYMFSAKRYTQSVSYYEKIFNSSVKYKITNAITSAAHLFEGNIIKLIDKPVINLFEEYFTNIDFSNCLNFEDLLSYAKFSTTYPMPIEEATININFYDGDFDENKIINLNRLLYGLHYNNNANIPQITINIINNNYISIREFCAAANIFKKKNDKIIFSDINKIKDCYHAFSTITFNYDIPIKHVIYGCNMEGIYYQATINVATEFDFSPNNIFYTYNDFICKDAFLYAKINKDFIFKNVDKLYHCYFDNITFSEPIFFDYDLVSEDNIYDKPRHITFKNTNITGIKDQELIIKYDPNNSSKWNSSTGYLFNNCKYIDFSNSNVILNISCTNNNQYIRFFNNCSSMIKTPILKGTMQLDYYAQDMFTGCISLEEIDGEDLKISRFSNYVLNLSTCVNLKYIRLKEMYCGLNLQNCTKLDSAVLYNTLSKNTHDSDLTIMKNVYDQFSDEQKTILIGLFPSINIVENETE